MGLLELIKLDETQTRLKVIVLWSAVILEIIIIIMDIWKVALILFAAGECKKVFHFWLFTGIDVQSNIMLVVGLFRASVEDVEEKNKKIERLMMRDGQLWVNY